MYFVFQGQQMCLLNFLNKVLKWSRARPRLFDDTRPHMGQVCWDCLKAKKLKRCRKSRRGPPVWSVHFVWSKLRTVWRVFSVVPGHPRRAEFRGSSEKRRAAIKCIAPLRSPPPSDSNINWSESLLALHVATSKCLFISLLFSLFLSLSVTDTHTDTQTLFPSLPLSLSHTHTHTYRHTNALSFSLLLSFDVAKLAKMTHFPFAL